MLLQNGFAKALFFMGSRMVRFFRQIQKLTLGHIFLYLDRYYLGFKGLYPLMNFYKPVEPKNLKFSHPSL